MLRQRRQHRSGFDLLVPAFGEEATIAPPAEERLRFTGHERDRSGEQLNYMHARFYRAGGSAKLLSVDPQG